MKRFARLCASFFLLIINTTRISLIHIILVKKEIVFQAMDGKKNLTITSYLDNFYRSNRDCTKIILKTDRFEHLDK